MVVTDPATVALIAIRDILGLWAASWFLDTGVGFPWFQQVLGSKNPNLTQIQALLRSAILSAPYVINVTASALFDSSARAFTYTFSAFLNTGEVITGGSAQAFRVQGAPGGAS